MRLKIHIWKSKFTCCKQYFFGLLFSKNAKKTNTDQGILQGFLFCLRKAFHKPLKSVFQVCLLLIQVASMNVFYLCNNWKEYFLQKFIVTQRLHATAVLLGSLKQVFWKKYAFYVRYLHNNNKMKLLLYKFSQKSYFLIAFLLHPLILQISQIFLCKWNSKAPWRHFFY